MQYEYVPYPAHQPRPALSGAVAGHARPHSQTNILLITYSCPAFQCSFKLPNIALYVLKLQCVLPCLS